MFNLTCLHKKPLLEKRDKLSEFPEHFQKMTSQQFWFYLDNDFIEQIVAMRVYAYQNHIALKIKPRHGNNYMSIILHEPELRILKRIWDCEHPGFSTLINYYTNLSSQCYRQWVDRTQTNDCISWYSQQNLSVRN